MQPASCRSLILSMLTLFLKWSCTISYPELNSHPLIPAVYISPCTFHLCRGAHFWKAGLCKVSCVRLAQQLWGEGAACGVYTVLRARRAGGALSPEFAWLPHRYLFCVPPALKAF